MNEMLTKVKKALARVIKNESGQAALVAVLILLLLGALMIPPLLGLMRTGLKAGQAHESRLQEFYAADAGVEDALYKIKHEKLPDWMKGSWGKDIYSHDPYEYSLGEVNSKGVELAIQPIWSLEGLETAKPGQGREPHDSLVTVGDVIGESSDGTKGLYQIGIIYDGSLGELKIERIGCWLPLGFEYVPGSSNLEENPGEDYYCVPTTSDFRGGTSIIWDYGKPGIDYDELPSSGSKKVVTFHFTPKENPHGSFSWIRTNRNDVYLSWDVDCKLYRITSTATSPSAKHTTITASAVKEEFRKYASGIEGDYQAIGNTLMRDNDHDFCSSRGCGHSRERLYKETSASVTSSDVPSNANAEQIRLYWSGWKNDPWDTWTKSDAEMQALPTTYKVNQVTIKVKLDEVKIKVGDSTSTYYDDEVTLTITADLSQVMRNGNYECPHGWTYSCCFVLTDQLKQAYRDKHLAGPDAEVSFNGQGIYTLGHAHLSGSGHDLYEWNDDHSKDNLAAEKTSYPLGDTVGKPYYNAGYGTYRFCCYYTGTSPCQDEWAYAAWSIITVYSSPTSKGHMLYLDDTFRYTDNDETQVFAISNFLAPQDVITDPDAARLTCFVADGDDIYTEDELKFKSESGTGYYNLSDPPINPEDDIWNSKSNVLPGITIDGIDIDTFSVQYPYIKPGDTEAELRMPTGIDSWNLVYVILSFRSEITIGGTISYHYETG